MTPQEYENNGVDSPGGGEKRCESTLHLHVLDDKLGETNTSNGKSSTLVVRKILLLLHRQRFFVISSLAFVVGWSCLWAWIANRLQDSNTSAAERWLQWLEEAGSKFRLVGILFVFAVVFRFNRCYDRWLQGRIIWGNIVSVSLDATRMASNWILDDEYADRFMRFVVVFAYATKALLRGNSLSDPVEEGGGLIERGYLTREELEDMDSSDGWQPYYCLDMLGAVWIEAHYPEKSLMFDAGHKVHSQLFRAIDGNISKLGTALGDAIRVRASGLPETYDDLHHVMFYLYFILAPILFSPTLGWALPILIGLESFLIMLIVLMGSALIEPFGTDKVDLPLELFCETIEVQVNEISERSKRKNLKRLARTSNACPARSVRPSPSISRTIKGDLNKKGTKEKFAKQEKNSQSKQGQGTASVHNTSGPFQSRSSAMSTPTCYEDI